MRELIIHDMLALDYILTKRIVADLLAKILTLTKYEYFINILGLENKRQKLPCRGHQQT